MSHKSQRLTWRARCRRWQCYINALLAVLVALVLATTPAQAGRWQNCRPTFGGQRCQDRAGHTWVVCQAGFKPQPQTLTCGVK